MSSNGTIDERVSETLEILVEAAASGEGDCLSVTEPVTLESVPGVSAPVSACVARKTGADSEPGFCIVAVTSPTVSTDHPSLLAYVARRARARKSPYFVTWNLRDASLWATPKKGEEVSAATCLKNYIDIFQIEAGPQTDLDAQAQIALVERAREILDDLSRLSEEGQLGLVSVDADFFVHRLTQAVSILAPVVQESLANRIKRDPEFRETISDWAVLQGIPANVTSTDFSESVSRQIIYRLLGKIIFYQSLRRSANQLPPLDLSDVDSSQVLPTLRRCFAKALEVDYHAVFREDIVDAIPFPRAASQELAALVEDLNTRDFASLPQDVVGEVFERLIPADERRSLGQYFTPEDLVDIIDAFCIRSADDHVLDPTCGTGTFLIRAYDRLQHLGRHEHTRLLQQLWGVDIAPFPAELATINLFRQRLSEHGNFPRIVCEDFFKVRPGGTFQFPPPKASANRPEFVDEEIPQFDAVVGNFPYISQDKIERRVKGYRDFLGQTLIEDWFADYPELFHYKRKTDQERYERLAARGEHTKLCTDALQHDVSTYADIYAHLFFHAARFLESGGRMGIVTSNAWIDVNFGHALQRFFLDRFKIVAILESRCEPWFEQASVNTIVTVLERCDDAAERDNHIVKFVKVKCRLRDLVPYDLRAESEQRWHHLRALVGRIESAGAGHLSVRDGELHNDLSGHETIEHGDFRIGVRRQGEMREEVAQAGKTVKWGRYLRAPRVFFDVARKAASSLVLLGDIACPKRGGLTRINEFFHVSPDVAEEHGIEDEYLLPLVKSPKDTPGITVRPEDSNLRIFVCRRAKAELKDLGHTGALNYIAWGEKQTYARGTFAGLRWPEGTWVAKREPGWWALPENETSTGQVFISQAFGSRHVHRFSHTPVVCDKRLYYLEPAEGLGPEQVAAVLNCALTALTTELSGRVSLGDGALELTVEDARDYLLVPDVRTFAPGDRQSVVTAFQAVLGRPIGSVFEEVQRDDRRALDEAVLRAMGLPLGMLDGIYQGLQTLVRERIQLGEMRSKARRSRPSQALDRVQQDVLEDVLPEGPKRFPDDFLTPSARDGQFKTRQLPEGELEVELSPLHPEVLGEDGFKLRLANTFEAKYVHYAHQAGHRTVRVPEAGVEVSRAVSNYEMYLRELRDALFQAFYKRTLDQQLATNLTARTFSSLGLPAPSSS